MLIALIFTNFVYILFKLGVSILRTACFMRMLSGARARGKAWLVEMAKELEPVSLRNGCGVRLDCIRLGAAITSLQLPNGCRRTSDCFAHFDSLFFQN